MDYLLLVLAIGIFIGFFVQTLMGFGGALVALPILLFKYSLKEAVSYLAIFYFLSSIYLIYKEKKNIDFKFLKSIFLMSFVGLFVGVLLLKFANPIFLNTILGVLIIAYVFFKLFYKKSNKKLGSFTKQGFISLGGLFSGLFSTGGPLFVIVVNQQLQSIQAFRATMIGVLGVISIVRVPVLFYNNLLLENHFINALKIFPVFILATFLGKKAFKHIDELLFKNILLTLLFVAGLSIVIKSLF